MDDAEKKEVHRTALVRAVEVLRQRLGQVAGEPGDLNIDELPVAVDAALKEITIVLGGDEAGNDEAVLAVMSSAYWWYILNMHEDVPLDELNPECVGGVIFSEFAVAYAHGEWRGREWYE